MKYLNKSSFKVEGFQATYNDCCKGISILFFLLISTNIVTSQNNCSLHDQGVKMIVNEIGNFGGDSNNGGTEYIELLVLGNPNNPNELVDIRGYLLDDNHASATDMGNEPGHVRFGDCFPLLPSGSLILIYNEKSPPIGVDRLLDGMPNSNGLYQVPFGSSCLVKYATPSHDSPDYGSYVPNSGDTGGEWKDYIPLRDYGDAIILGNENGEVLQSFYWFLEEWYVDSELEFIKPYNPTQEIALSLDPDDLTSCFALENSNWLSGSSYKRRDSGTPGLPNSEANNSFIQSIKAGGNTLDLFEVDFELGLYAEGFSIGPFLSIYSSSYPCDLIVTEFGGIVLDMQLTENDIIFLDMIKDTPGEYQYFIESSVCDLNGTFIIPPLNELEELLCESECEEFDFDVNDVGSNSSSDCFVLVDNSGNIISTDNGVVEVCGDEDAQEFISVIKDEEGNVIEVNKTTFKSANQDVELEIEKELICDGETTEITCLGSNIESYIWSTGEGTSSITVSEAGIYSVTVIDDSSCEIIRETEIFDQSQLHEYFINESYSCVIYDDIELNLSFTNETEYISEELEILGFFENEVFNINDEVRETFRSLNSSIPNVFSTIRKIESCEDIIGLKGNNSSNDKRSRTSNAWFENEVLALNNLDSDNTSIYIRNNINMGENNDPKLYLVNKVGLNESKLIAEINHFIGEIELDISVESTIPVITELGKNEIFCVIGENPNTTARIIYSIPAIFNNIPNDIKMSLVNYPQPCSNIGFWLSLTDDETESWELAANPLIQFNDNAFQYHMDRNTYNPLNGSNDNMLDGNIERLYGFITLHAIGHTSKIVHKLPSLDLEFGYIEGIGFMSNGNKMADYLLWPYAGGVGGENTSAMEAPTFEALIKLTSIHYPEMINYIKDRFE